MRIKGFETISREVNVTVDEFEVLKSLRYKAYDSLDIRAAAFLNSKGQLVEDEDHYHGTISEKVLDENPSELQVTTIQAFNHIERILCLARKST